MIIHPVTEGKEVVTVRGKCVFCPKTNIIAVPLNAYYGWLNGNFAKEAFPTLTADELEFFFVGGICSTCWEAM